MSTTVIAMENMCLHNHMFVHAVSTIIVFIVVSDILYTPSHDSKQDAITAHNMQKMMEKLKVAIKNDLKELRR